MEQAKNTKSVHLGRPQQYPGSPLNVSPVFSSTYIAGGERIYSRSSQEAVEALEEVVGGLEEGKAVAFASGLAACSGVIDSLSFLFHRPISVLALLGSYTGTINQFEARFRSGQILYKGVDASSTKSFCDAIEASSGVDIVWMETPTNPLMSIYDIEAIASSTHLVGGRLCVDNTFATPISTNPLELGADVVVHSATKYLSGHSDVLGGVVVTKDREWHGSLVTLRTLNGAILGPMEAFLILRGVRTLGLRIERASGNSLSLASFLAAQSQVISVNHPFLGDESSIEIAKRQMRFGGGMFSFDLGPNPYRAELFCESLEIALNSTSLGGVETQVERRARQDGKRVSEGLIRVSVGIESIDDLIGDFRRGLGRAFAF
ncbi:trans-sulfuration enzyme family protein [Acidithrix ferrooxidans]|uniref:Cystathionine gamma-synthase n=1 Tax=Acidithrix ferrooxidans TaxID=1280514 RepID=A0A0D8HEZ5_9ACTN|nr:PLP-dependent transferase [Acidithrix ferrooxidans]KJF16439.1 cystathionine gamma-synthase [Acidithrix ferrooxidans]